MTYHITMDNILNERLHLLPLDTLVTMRQLRFLQKAANLPTTRLTRQVINSHAIAADETKISGGNHLSTRCSLRKALEKAKLVKPNTGGPLKEWIPLLRKNNIGTQIEAELGLPENTFSKPRRPR